MAELESTPVTADAIDALSLALDPTSTMEELEQCPPAPNMNHIMDEGEGSDATPTEIDERLVPPAEPPAWPPCSPRSVQRRRAQAQPLRCDAAAAVVCYRYAQGKPEAAGAEGSNGRWQGRKAHLHYFLPENWSPSYKFTVFEDSYVLSFAREADPWPPTAYHLARPLCSGARTPADGATALPEFELVWPVELDTSLLESVEAACDRVVPGAKRKPQEVRQPLSVHSVHLKLQRLNV